MEYIAESKNVDISPRKVRLVVDTIKKLELTNALSVLKLLKKRSANPIRKTVESAIANAKNNFKAAVDNLLIKEIIVNEGISYKRYHFGGRGKMRPYKKRRSHIKVILSERNSDGTKS